jgi:hypothetical protein
LDEIGLAVYEKMSIKVKVIGRTTTGRRMKSVQKSSPCHFVTVEQIIYINILTIAKRRPEQYLVYEAITQKRSYYLVVI